MHVYVYVCAPIFFNETINKKTKKITLCRVKEQG